MQLVKLTMALFASAALAAPAASPVDVDESPATNTVMLNVPTAGAIGPIPQACCFKVSWHGVEWGCGKKFCGK
jgi:hypothetical protein